MSKMQLTILGCGSAIPTEKHFNTSQILSIGDKVFMIDCGEGTQIRMRQFKVKTAKLNHIFISHLHGDHCFGLIGLISTLGILGRKNNLYVHAHADLETLLQPHIDFFCQEMPFKVVFNHINPRANKVIFEDKTVKVSTIPLKHAIPACGFLFEEKESDRHLIREKINFYKIPIKYLQHIKKGADYVTPDGTVIPNAHLTRPGEPSKKYAYCSDTAYYEKIIPIIQGANCVFHEATFQETEAKRAKETFHSTASQAATIAKEAGVKQLLIGHYSARYKNAKTILAEAKAIFENCQATVDGDVIEI